MPTEVEEILLFWFGGRDEPGYGEFRQAWFTKDPEFDREIRDRFEPVRERAASGELDDWKSEPRSSLALVILLDQFPRNMFRDTPEMYATDEKALETSRRAIERAHDGALDPVERMFVYMPLMHSENIEDQRRSVELFDILSVEPGLGDLPKYAVGHMRIVERFGRFPHRNAILGRDTTPEEAKFLEEPDSSY